MTQSDMASQYSGNTSCQFGSPVGEKSNDTFESTPAVNQTSATKSCAKKPPHDFTQVGEGNRKYCYHPDIRGGIFRKKFNKVIKDMDVSRVTKAPFNVVSWCYRTILKTDPPGTNVNNNTKRYREKSKSPSLKRNKTMESINAAKTFEEIIMEVMGANEAWRNLKPERFVEENFHEKLMSELWHKCKPELGNITNAKDKISDPSLINRVDEVVQTTLNKKCLHNNGMVENVVNPPPGLNQDIDTSSKDSKIA